MKKEIKAGITICTMLVIITWLHYSTHPSLVALHDFYRIIYYVPIIIAAFRFRLKGGIFTSVIVTLVYAPHLLTYFGEINIQILNQLLEIIMFMVVGLITGYLVEKDFRKRNLLEQQIIKLTDLENYTQNILNSIDSAVIAIDCCRRIRSINRRGRAIFGDNSEIEKFFRDNNFFVEIERLIQKKVTAFEKEVLYQANNNEFHLKVSSYPILNIQEVIEGVVVLVQDITTVKRLEAQLRRGEKLATVGQLASGIAHEIRNPLAIIKTISQTINSNIEEGEFREGLEIINHEINRANNVIKDLLDFAKPNKGQITNIDMEKLLNELLTVTQRYAKQRGIEIDLKIQQSSFLQGDEEKLKQAFINIFLNGIQSMDQGGTLEIRLIIGGNFAIISFKDQGSGIDEELLDKIFDPFFTTKDYGTGLGLSITHRIIEEHNGRIEVVSKINKGTEIRVYLPLRKEEDNND